MKVTLSILNANGRSLRGRAHPMHLLSVVPKGNLRLVLLFWLSSEERIDLSH